MQAMIIVRLSESLQYRLLLSSSSILDVSGMWLPVEWFPVVPAVQLKKLTKLSNSIGFCELLKHMKGNVVNSKATNIHLIRPNQFDKDFFIFSRMSPTT